MFINLIIYKKSNTLDYPTTRTMTYSLNPKTIILIYLTIFNFNAFAFPLNDSDLIINSTREWNLRILHTNDMHGRFDEILNEETDCTNDDKIAHKCLGGFARIATLVREARNTTNSVLYLDAGDVYRGTSWFTQYKWRISSKFMNILKPDAADNNKCRRVVN